MNTINITLCALIATSLGNLQCSEIAPIRATPEQRIHRILGNRVNTAVFSVLDRGECIDTLNRFLRDNANSLQNDVRSWPKEDTVLEKTMVKLTSEQAEVEADKRDTLYRNVIGSLQSALTRATPKS